MSASRLLKTGLRPLGCVGLVSALASILGAYLGALSPFLDLAGQFALQAGLGAAAIAVLFLLVHQWRLAAGGALTAALALPLFLPRAGLPSCDEPAAHRIVFLNVWSDNPDIDQAIHFLASSDADVILLAEIRPQFDRAMAPLRDIYPYTVECPGLKGCDLIALSRVPLTQRISERQVDSMIGLEVDFPDGRLDLAGVHLPRPWPIDEFGAQSHDLKGDMRAIGTMARPKLVLGDFNAVTWSGTITRMTRQTGLAPLPSLGTWRTNLPWPLRLPIDHALVGPGLECATKTVSRRLSSDHRAILVDFDFTAPDRSLAR